MLDLLFIGNSYTFFNDLPATVARMLETVQPACKIGRFLRGGAALKDHWLDNAGVADGRNDQPREAMTLALAEDRVGQLDALLREAGPETIVILQGQSHDTIYTPVSFTAYGQKLADKCKQAGVTRFLLYLTAAWRIMPETQKTITRYYRELANVIGAHCVPVGEAFARVYAERPDIAVHVADNSHPTAEGSYLAACCFFAVLAKRSPVGLPHVFPEILWGEGNPPAYRDLTAETARYLQEAADATVQAWQAGAQS